MAELAGEIIKTLHGSIFEAGTQIVVLNDTPVAECTISICPFVSKGLDCYISYLYSSYWDRMQEPTQYQGKDSSHELASLLVSELIQHSLNVLKKPLYILYLDARSAFDLVIREFLI